jgi:hypothetical protein
MELIGHRPDYTGHFGDKRLANRAEKLAQSLLNGKTSSIHGTTQTEAEQRGFYRFLGNENVKETELIEELTHRCRQHVGNRHLVVIQDSSSVGLSQQANHIKPGSGVGLIGNKIGLGFITHISLVIDADSEAMLGFADVQLWHRTAAEANSTTKSYKQKPIEEKESYKWIKASKQTQQCLASAQSITIIQDREGDIYEQFCIIPNERTQLIIRNRDNRRLADGSKLHDQLSQTPALGSYTIAVQSDIRKGKINRTAIVEVKCKAVTIQKPALAKTKDIPDTLLLYAVEVKEHTPNVPQPICWRLLTTCKVETYEEAINIIDRYKQRWHIEQLFRLLKKQGYQIEDSQLENGWAIRKLFVLVLNAALRVMQLYLAYGEEQCQPTNEVFSEEEIKCLEVIETKHIIKTQNTNNPFPKEKLAWASWIIARLGGWKGNNKLPRAGPILLKEGLDKFEAMYQGWQLANSINSKDVS